MTAGYWTILYVIIYCILIGTGWRIWLDKYIATTYGILFFIIVFATYRIATKPLLFSENMSVSIHVSIIYVGIVLIGALLKSKMGNSFRYSLLSVLMFGLFWALIQALLHYSPWLKGALYGWDLPILSGILLAFLSLTVGQVCYVIFFGALLGECLFAWQQEQYIGAIGTLGWWDLLLNTFVIVLAARFIVHLITRGLHLMARMIMK